MPEEKPGKEKAKGNPRTWDETIGDLMAKGIMPWQVARMTRKQLHLLVGALNIELELRYKLAGFEVKETQEVTIDNLGALEAAINGAVKQR